MFKWVLVGLLCVAGCNEEKATDHPARVETTESKSISIDVEFFGRTSESRFQDVVSAALPSDASHVVAVVVNDVNTLGTIEMKIPKHKNALEYIQVIEKISGVKSARLK